MTWGLSHETLGTLGFGCQEPPTTPSGAYLYAALPAASGLVWSFLLLVIAAQMLRKGMA